MKKGVSSRILEKIRSFIRFSRAGEPRLSLNSSFREADPSNAGDVDPALPHEGRGMRALASAVLEDAYRV